MMTTKNVRSRNFLPDLDNTFFELLVLVPVQFNSHLINMLSDPEDSNLDILNRDNNKIGVIKKFLSPWLKDSPHARAPFPKGY